MKFRTGLMLGVAFAAGMAIAPGGDMLNGPLRAPLAFLAPAWAQDAAKPANSKAETYRLLNLFADVFERVRAEYVEPVSDKDLIENAINGMLTGLDPHSNYMNANAYRDMQVQTSGQFGGLGIEVTQEDGFIKVISPIDDTPASRAGVKAGDLIVALDGATVQGLALNDAVEKMRGAPNSKILLTIRRAGAPQPLELTLTREVIKIQVVKSHLEAGDIGYIRVSSFSEQTDSGLKKAYASLKEEANGQLAGIILDLRNNPGGLLDQAVAVSEDFIDRGEVVSTKARRPEDGQRFNAQGGDITGGLPLVVLINGGSASASEIVAGALQDHRRAVLVGTRSFGKGSVQTVIALPGNGAMRLTTARYYTPSGRSIQGLGITPDVEVQFSRTEPLPGIQTHEADLKGAIANKGGTADNAAPARNDLPAIVKDIAKLPPEDWPAFDPTKDATDYQLQQADKILHAMAASKRAAQ